MADRQQSVISLMNVIKKQKIIVILGPTASGKSDLAVQIAIRLSSGQTQKKFGIKGAEIISADSRQVYRGLDIGSGKVPRDSQSSILNSQFLYKGVPHYLLDVASPNKTFTASQFQKLGKSALKKIIKKGKIPIVCGGTGLYIDSLIYEYPFPEVPPQKELRKKLEKLTTEELFKKLQKLDPKRAETIDKNNRPRLIRSLEIVITTGKPIPKIELFPATLINKSGQNYQILKMGIKKSPKELGKLIRKRLEKRMKIGMIKEVENGII